MIEKLRLVEIELFSYCNRKCPWCPNREIDRHSFCQIIEDEVLFSVLKDLALHNYQGAITFSRYNEPLSKIDIFKEKLQIIKQALPNNKLITNTNGDFITKENLDGLIIDELTIMDYDGMGVDGCVERLVQAGATIDKVQYPYVFAHYDNMQILYFVDWQDNRLITDRGGFLKELSEEIRNKPCYEPTYFVGINYDGTVSPCCNVRNDIEQHKPFILGDLHGNTLKEILLSSKTNNFRDSCANAIFVKGTPCYTCKNNGGRYTRGKGGISYE